MIEGDRANYDSYDYHDYDLYAYDEDEDEKLREEYKLKQELSEILDKLNMTTTESPLPNAVRISCSVANFDWFFKVKVWYPSPQIFASHSVEN